MTKLALSDRNKIVNLYEKRLGELGYSPKTVGWKDSPQQELRFKVLTGIARLNGAKVCDVGCGFGDMYRFLHKLTSGNIKYVGIDISEKMIESARRLYPKCEFLVEDILSPYKRKFDYVFLSGAFNVKIKNNADFSRAMIRRMFDMADRGIAFNMFTTYVDYKDRNNFYYNPGEIFKYAKSLTKYVVLRHDYPLWEFTIYMYKNRPPEVS